MKTCVYLCLWIKSSLQILIWVAALPCETFACSYICVKIFILFPSCVKIFILFQSCVLVVYVSGIFNLAHGMDVAKKRVANMCV